MNPEFCEILDVWRVGKEPIGFRTFQKHETVKGMQPDTETLLKIT
jgi:hypothetical protein